jgi:diguanylate cyclase (GGDEF)-like protein
MIMGPCTVMEKKWNWLEPNQIENTVSAHLLCDDTALTSLFHSVINAAEAAWDMYCSVLLLNTNDHTLHNAAAPSLPKKYCQAIEGLAIGVGVGSCGTAAITKEVVIVKDIQNHPYWATFKELAKESNLFACWSTPILNHEQRVLGTFACYFPKVQQPTTRQLEFMSAASKTLAVSIEQHQIQRVVTHLSYFDPLTGLQNRSAFRKSLQQLIDIKQKFALFFLDLDHFKEINDTLGHDSGDKLLQTLSNRFKKLESDTISFSRIGGDEFTVIYQFDKERSIESFAEKLIAIVNQPLQCANTNVQISASLGIACFPKDGQELSPLMRHADIAMYHAKSIGRNQSSMFNDQMKNELLERIALQKELRIALDENQFEVYYQPQVNAKTQQLVSLEALLRWQHPIKGLLNADLFIEVLESSGGIEKIDLQVLEQSCLSFCGHKAPFSLSVNLSSTHLTNESFPDQVFAILAKTGFSAQQLVLEVTERTLIQNTNLAAPIMHRLRDSGIRFSIDDFGTGYSSLKYLKMLPIDEVKIDKSFVEDITTDNYDKQICASLCRLANKLNLHIVAEGVEQLSQLQALVAMGCTTLQGYYISHPLSTSDIKIFIKQLNKSDN